MRILADALLAVEDQIARLEAEILRERNTVKAISKQVHDALQTWAKELDEQKAHECAKKNRKSISTPVRNFGLMNFVVAFHDELVAHGDKIAVLREDLHALYAKQKDGEFDDFDSTQVERERK